MAHQTDELFEYKFCNYIHEQQVCIFCGVYRLDYWSPLVQVSGGSWAQARSRNLGKTRHATWTLPRPSIPSLTFLLTMAPIELDTVHYNARMAMIYDAWMVSGL